QHRSERHSAGEDGRLLPLLGQESERFRNGLRPIIVERHRLHGSPPLRPYRRNLDHQFRQPEPPAGPSRRSRQGKNGARKYPVTLPSVRWPPAAPFPPISAS